MTTFPQLPAEDRVLLLNKFNELGLDPPPPQSNCSNDVHDCCGFIKVLGHIDVDGTIKQIIRGCAVCGKIRGQNGCIEPTTTLSVLVQSCVITGAEVVNIIPTIDGKRLHIKPRELQVTSMLNFLKAELQSATLSEA